MIANNKTTDPTTYAGNMIFEVSWAHSCYLKERKEKKNSKLKSLKNIAVMELFNKFSWLFKNYLVYFFPYIGCGYKFYFGSR